MTALTRLRTNTQVLGRVQRPGISVQSDAEDSSLHCGHSSQQLGSDSCFGVSACCSNIHSSQQLGSNSFCSKCLPPCCSSIQCSQQLGSNSFRSVCLSACLLQHHQFLTAIRVCACLLRQHQLLTAIGVSACLIRQHQFLTAGYAIKSMRH